MTEKTRSRKKTAKDAQPDPQSIALDALLQHGQFPAECLWMAAPELANGSQKPEDLALLPRVVLDPSQCLTSMIENHED